VLNGLLCDRVHDEAKWRIVVRIPRRNTGCCCQQEQHNNSSVSSVICLYSAEVGWTGAEAIPDELACTASSPGTARRELDIRAPVYEEQRAALSDVTNTQLGAPGARAVVSPQARITPPNLISGTQLQATKPAESKEAQPSKRRRVNEAVGVLQTHTVCTTQADLLCHSAQARVYYIKYI
jgi:hypothetical protein